MVGLVGRWLLVCGMFGWLVATSIWLVWLVDGYQCMVGLVGRLSQHADTRPTIPRTDPTSPGAWQGRH